MAEISEEIANSYSDFIFRFKYLFYLSFLFILYNEIFCHYLQSFNWNAPECTGNCTKILLVADPQLLGNTYDKNIYNGLAIYDSDK